ncbi:ABC transporter substrate-binding protein [Neptunomonas phycophila]|uniref:ABC transporter substrate-binding protein n=1 Tax=Neptunomonas TaxID=75687 RepID=UPI0025AF3618|nr:MULTISPECIES: ABC transporter substrate-binding protein [Neptunomonas]MDN2659181.1 ABC transporter substrate-binding protein [Neptunomonas sp. CHC150]MDO6784775.1 ABC transporter substrate-binding protein [Neptunomonas phycophila]
MMSHPNTSSAKKSQRLAIVLALITCAATLGITSSNANAEITTRIAYLAQTVDTGPVLSNILPEPEDAGLRGTELAINDSNTTGKFLKQHFELSAYTSDDSSSLLEHAQQLYTSGIHSFVVNAPADTLRTLSQQLPDDVLIFNAAAKDDNLRQTVCLKNTLHTIPSRAMLADALGQWLKARQLSDLLLITGPTDDDKAYTQAIKRTAKRYGLKIVAEKAWDFDTDLRRTAQREMPLFTQTKEYDVVVVADERGDFGEYVLYNTWYPRPVVGTQGLTPVTWHRVVEQWGAAQLQSRFEKLSGRWMTEKDYAAWAAVRTIAEAATRTNSEDIHTLKQYIASDAFELAGFKGRKLDFRAWNGQLRQPIPLVHPRSLVSQSPQEGFLHPLSELDTLGFDKPESQCNLLADFR